MKSFKLAALSVISLVMAVTLFSLVVAAQSPLEENGQGQGDIGRPPVVTSPARYDVSPPLRDLPPVADPTFVAEGREIPRLDLAKARAANNVAAPFQDPVLQSSPGDVNMPSPNLTFEGVNNRNNVAPPDTNGDVGPNHYVQWVNLSIQIWNKSGVSVYGPVNGNTLWQGFGGPCQTYNHGDPIALYDRYADRWLLSQFAVPGGGTGWWQCIAVSTSGDPTGSYYRYAYQMPVNKMNDYPKFGVWPDGYYMSANLFTNGASWGGAGAFAFDRAKMLAGQSAQMIFFDLYSRNPNFGGMLPSHSDGPTPPPQGAPNYFAEVDDNWNGTPGNDILQIWKFHVDWTTPSNSTFGVGSTYGNPGVGGNPDTVLPVASFNSNLCNYSRACIPQPDTTNKLDAISDRLMYRLQYRNFGDHESLVVNHTVNVASSGNRAGVRWYEVRSPGTSPTVYQQGTYAPDSDSTNRWMGSVAMDGAGNMALGYSVSDSTVYPGIRYTGRLAGDPLGQMSQGEAVLKAGTGSQTSAYNRWGDYSTMSVDPSDDCTFWYTQEYYQTTSGWGWQTRIGSFKFPSCGSATQGTLSGVVSDAGTGTGISGARVDVAGTFAIANASGNYSLTIPTGTYTLTASASGYISQTDTNVVVTTTTVHNFSLQSLATDATLVGTVSLQGREVGPPADPYSIPVRYQLIPSQPGTTLSGTVNTNLSAQFTLSGITPGVYTVKLKNSHTLTTTTTVDLLATTNYVSFCALPEGDADDSGQVNIADFSIFSAAYGKQEGQPGFDARADFNESGQINIADFSALATNFGRYGDQACP